MLALADIQRAFAANLLAPENATIESWVSGDGLAAAQRTAIYRNTFHGVIVGALRIAYPVVERLVGAEFFEGAARHFLAAHPPRVAYLNDYGAEFADFLAAFEPAATLLYLADVARLEWAVAGAANAPDAPALDPTVLGNRPPEEIARLRLIAHPALQLVTIETPADLIWRAITEDDEAALPTIRIERRPIAVLVHRTDRGIVMRRLTAGERSLTGALMARRPIGEAVALAPEEEAMVILAEHLAGGRFTRVETEDGR